MPVPSDITALSTTAASNSPLGSESPATADDYFRAHAAFIAQLRAVIGGAADANIPNAYATTAQVNDYVANQSQNSGTTGGTLTAYTLSPVTAITSYAANKTFWVKFHVASGASPTIQISGLSSPPTLVRQIAAGTYAAIGAGEIPAGHLSRVTLLSATQALVEDMPPSFADSVRIDVASAATVNLTTGAPNTRHINITGAIAIIGFTVAAGQCYFVRFNEALPLTNGASLVTQTGANIVTEAGDTCILRATANNVVEVLCYARAQRLTVGTAQATTSGTSIDFTAIPSWVRRIVVMLSGVSTSGSSPVQLQLGTSSGVELSGYDSAASLTVSASSASARVTSGFALEPLNGTHVAAATARQGLLTLCKINGNEWVISGSLAHSNATGVTTTVAGNKTLSGLLDRVRLTTVNGTDTFDAGSINIMYEG